MVLEAAPRLPSSALECTATLTTFWRRGKVRKNPSNGSSASASEKKRMTLLNPVLGENLEDLHCQKLLNFVLGENLEDL